MTAELTADDRTSLEAAVDAAVGGLLFDKDVSRIDVVEGSLPEVVRRGRRERLQLLIAGELFPVVQTLLQQHDRHESSTPLVCRLKNGLRLHAAQLVDGRIAVSVVRPPPTDVELRHLVEEGVLPVGVDDELRQVVLQGHGVIITGPVSCARTRLGVALARAVAQQLRVVSITPHAVAHGVPAPAGGPDLVHVVHAAVELGADLLFAVDLPVPELVKLTRAPLPVPLVCTVPATSLEVIQQSLAPWPLSSAAAAIAVVGRDAQGLPRVIELHGGLPGEDVDASPPMVAAALPATTPAAHAATHSAAPAIDERAFAATPPMPSSPVMAPRPAAGGRGAPPLPPLPILNPDDAPPAEWASQHIDDDPGWELGPVGDTPATAGSFDAALEIAASRTARPFQPRPPPAHPQAAFLKGTGGLSFGPPGGPSGDSDDEGSGL